MAAQIRLTEAEMRALLAMPVPRKARTKKTCPRGNEGYPCTEPVMLVLPWCPLNNRTWRHVGGRVLLSQEARAYRSAVALAVLEQWPSDMGKPFNSRLQCTIIAHAPDKRRYDIDGIPKSVEDSLQRAGVFLDDWQFDALHIFRGMPQKNGVIIVTIGPIL